MSDESAESDELDLLAFRYVAGEMPPEEAGEFELRMAEDQAARDAMTQAVAVAERLLEARPAQESPVIAMPVGPPAVAGTWRHALRALGWMASGAAAVLLGVILVRPGVLRQPAADVPRHAAPVQPIANALVWARLQTASQWADEQDERWLDEVEATLPSDRLEFERAYPSPTWLHGTESKNGVKQ